ncbi:uncharacterized protein LOC123334206 [Bubalus bubalis]|uniref:uncharacterized protein LOC123334206 n=1 Tax=Bubalus bubalis TaxID=89462 RepID=UPI001E1B6D69|nr:uncharacterized protein LOC123334206 [Bubalus bubalis]
MRKRNVPAAFTRRQPSGQASRLSRGSSTAGIVQWGESGGRPGVERSGEGFHSANYPPHLPRTPAPPPPPGYCEARRRGQDHGAPVAPASLRRGGRPLSRAEATATRFLGLCDGLERERELPPNTTLGDTARRIDRGWELRARTFRKSTGASSGAAPPPPPARLPFRVVTQPAGYAEVCPETRNLPGRGPRLPAPAQPRAARLSAETCAGLGAGSGDWRRAARAAFLREPERREIIGIRYPENIVGNLIV